MSGPFDRLGFLEGRFVGEGTELERKFRSTAFAEVLVQDSFFLVREEFEYLDTGDRFTDASLYRYDAGREGLSVMHLNDGGRMNEYPVVFEGEFLRWYLGPDKPKVLFWKTDAGWSVRIGPVDSPTITLVYTPVPTG